MNQSSPSANPYPRHLLSTAGLSASFIESILNQAEAFYQRNQQSDKKHPVLRGLTQINLFYENSTRTRTSFELAGKRLGMDVININTQVSSAGKGETLIDTAMTLNAMQPDVLVIRHPQSGAAELMANFVNYKGNNNSNYLRLCHVINGGDGSHQHPTQALLDAFAITMRKGKVKGLRVAICGDIAHSRVARSNIHTLKALGADVCLIAPPQLMPSKAETLGCDTEYNLNKGIKDADVVMVLRIQMERLQGVSIASVREYYHLYGLSHERLAAAKKDAIVMHPGPINRGVEISTHLADELERNTILDQVEAGVAVRQAILVDMLGEKQ